MAPKFLNPHTRDLREISSMDDFPDFRSSRDAFVPCSHTIRGFESRYDSGAYLCPQSDVAATQGFGHEFSRDQGSQEEISSQSYEDASTGHDLIASSLLYPRDVVRVPICGPPSLFSNNIGAVAMEFSPVDSPVVSSFEQMDAIAPADTFRFINASTLPAPETREVSPGASFTTDSDSLDDTDDEGSEDNSTDIAPSRASRSTGTRSPSLTPSASSSQGSSLAMPSPQATSTASRNVQIPASITMYAGRSHGACMPYNVPYAITLYAAMALPAFILSQG
ncbi:hypothetical protein A0H81_06806 [Grifola frondosa]|uniref:Uncharacterized protein n=1 Tax=Grifola frondosa TaxID=5627 RepID=A0A1C7M7N3_GRIFR|nr:hypothetical protein A0H81_06806 [Grifola frondosa]